MQTVDITPTPAACRQIARLFTAHKADAEALAARAALALDALDALDATDDALAPWGRALLAASFEALHDAERARAQHMDEGLEALGPYADADDGTGEASVACNAPSSPKPAASGRPSPPGMACPSPSSKRRGAHARSPKPARWRCTPCALACSGPWPRATSLFPSSGSGRCWASATTPRSCTASPPSRPAWAATPRAMGASATRCGPSTRRSTRRMRAPPPHAPPRHGKEGPPAPVAPPQRGMSATETGEKGATHDQRYADDGA